MGDTSLTRKSDQARWPEYVLGIAFLLVFITQVILGRLLDFHLFATGLLLVILVLGAPGGILGLAKSIAARRRAGMAPAG